MAVDPLPSDAELKLFQALWERPGATVHEVHDWIVEHDRQLSYTTVLTQLQRMHKKGLVKRERKGLQHRYRAVHGREAVEAELIDRLSDKAFEGSAVKLALKALGTQRPSSEELAELERWLSQQKKGND